MNITEYYKIKILIRMTNPNTQNLTVQGPVGRRNGGRTVVIPAVSGEGEGEGNISEVVGTAAVVVEGSSVVVETDVVSVVMAV